MNNYQKQTAVLYFTRSAGEEARAKTFCQSGNFAQNRAIAQKLICHTDKQIQASGLPVKVFTSASQQGHSFGEKLGNAFQSLFTEGYENVIAVGNDCLQLSADTIRNAAELLQHNSLVVGPSADGGTYLLGITQKAFQQKTFSALAWQTESLLDDFIQYARHHQLSLKQLCVAFDIDNEESLRQFICQVSYGASYARLLLLIQSIFSGLIYWYQKREVARLSPPVFFSLYHRGPPLG